MAEDKKFGHIAVLSHEKNKGFTLNGLDASKHSKLLKEAFKSEVLDEEVKFPKELGATHPFDFQKVDKVLENMGLANAGVNIITDSIMGDFQIKTNDPKSQKLLDSLVEDADLLSHLRPWVKEGVGKGNGYMDLTNLLENQIRTINANCMWVRRNTKGKVLKYNQFLGRKKGKITLTKQNVNTFEPNEVAHLKVNETPGDAYGRGSLWSNMKTLNNYASSELSSHQLLERKAGAPIIVKVGQPGESVQQTDLDDFRELLQYMTNKTEWVVDGNIDITKLEFKDIAKSSTDAANHDMEQFAIGMQIPMVLLGVANVPEGLAKAQLESYTRYINSIRVIIEDVIETQILRPYLQTQGIGKNEGFDGKVDFIWDLPGEEVKDKRLTTIQGAMGVPYLTPELRAALEKEYAEVLGLEDIIDQLEEPADARKRHDEEIRKQEEEQIKQPEVPGEKPTAKESTETMMIEIPEDAFESPKEERGLTENELMELPISEYVNLTELPGFNYTDYLVKILQALKLEKFNDLRAITEVDLAEGLLPAHDIEKLRLVLKNGFRKNLTIREIEKDISNSIALKDRKKEVDGQLKITQQANKRPNAIARTETVRLANQGLKDLYKENDVKKYRYLAALDDRTSDVCMSLNGQVFNVEDGMPGTNMPPMHTNCRSTIVGIIE